MTYQIGAENLAGLCSKNRLAEDLFLPIFKTALKLPNLRNLNQNAANFPFIDLADDGKRVAIQVSSETSADKITETLEGFMAKGYSARYDRLVIFLLTAERLKYYAPTKKKWAKLCRNRLTFNPASDIINTQGLYALIQSIRPAEIFTIHDIIASSIIGEEYIDIEKCLAQQVTQQLDYEKKSTKYIPDVFVETPGTKTLARLFSHPGLFFGRTLDELGRTRLPFLNDFLRSVGWPLLRIPDLTTYYSKRTLTEIAEATARLNTELTPLRETAVSYKELSIKQPPLSHVPNGRQHLYEQLSYKIQNAGWGLQHTLEDIQKELTVARVRVFILTGRAGQGKTNLVCDFVENFLMKHRIWRSIRARLWSKLGIAGFLSKALH